MAQFTGTGQLRLNGPDARFYDFECQNTGGFVMNGNGQRLENCVMETDVSVASGVDRALISDNHFMTSGIAVVGQGFIGLSIQDNYFISEGSGVEFDLTGTGAQLVTVAGNLFLSQQAPAILVTGTGPLQAHIADNNIYNCLRGISIESNVGPGAFTSGHRITIKDNSIIEPARHGIYNVSDRAVIQGNIVEYAGFDTGDWDGIHLAAGECHVFDNTVKPLADWATTPVTRYGINVASGDCNIVVGNALGDPADYDTDALNDAGTNTQLVYPADPTYGDNFTECPPGSA